MKYTCPSCHLEAECTDFLAGLAILCKKCQHSIRLPKLTQEQRATPVPPSIPPEDSGRGGGQKRKDEEARVAAEQKRVAAEQKRKDEEARVAAEQKRKDEEARVAAEQKRKDEEARVAAGTTGSEHYRETTPTSAAEKTAAMRQLIDELTGFKFKRPGGKETMQTALQIMLRSREDMLDRVAYYRGWMSEGTFPDLKLFVLDRVSDEMRFPHMMFLTGPLNATVAFLSDGAYESRVKKYVPRGRLETADTYQDFDAPGFTSTKRIGWDFADKILEPGLYGLSLILEPIGPAPPSSPAPADAPRPTAESVTRAIESAGGTVRPRTDEPDRGGLEVTVRDVAVLPHLVALPDVQVLNLSSVGVGDAGLAHLTPLTSLDKVSLDRTGITDAGLKHLGQLTGLREIGLSGTLVSDNGLQHLVRLKRLAALWVRDTRLTKAGLDAFARGAGIMVISDLHGMHPS